MFEDRAVVITGGTSGIGAACVEEFLSLGGITYAIGRDSDKADRLSHSLSNPRSLRIIIGDVGSAKFANEAIEQVVRETGRLDVLVNCAAVMRRGNALELSDDDWHESLRINVSGTFFMCRAALPHMKVSGGGAIVNVSSDWGLVAGKEHVAYCTGKGAIVNLTRALALDHAADKIRVNVVCPGEVKTPMLESGLIRRGYAAADGFEELGRTIPIGRVSNPVEQARCIRFLASDDASYITGAVLSVDGGSTAH
jgi:meso-butanediol dehydrogenase / (S,S)-butanediol dehydrogenase / diacetyl reductase